LRELSEVGRDSVIDSPALRGIAATFLHPARCPPEPTHAPIMAQARPRLGQIRVKPALTRQRLSVIDGRYASILSVLRTNRGPNQDQNISGPDR
jgi:hypothetical protein